MKRFPIFNKLALFQQASTVKNITDTVNEPNTLFSWLFFKFMFYREIGKTITFVNQAISRKIAKHFSSTTDFVKQVSDRMGSVGSLFSKQLYNSAI